MLVGRWEKPLPDSWAIAEPFSSPPEVQSFTVALMFWEFQNQGVLAQRAPRCWAHFLLKGALACGKGGL